MIFASVSAGGRVCRLFFKKRKEEKKKKVAAVCRYLSLSVGAHPSPRLTVNLRRFRIKTADQVEGFTFGGKLHSFGRTWLVFPFKRHQTRVS